MLKSRFVDLRQWDFHTKYFNVVTMFSVVFWLVVENLTCDRSPALRALCSSRWWRSSRSRSWFWYWSWSLSGWEETPGPHRTKATRTKMVGQRAHCIPAKISGADEKDVYYTWNIGNKVREETKKRKFLLSAAAVLVASAGPGPGSGLVSGPGPAVLLFWSLNLLLLQVTWCGVFDWQVAGCEAMKERWHSSQTNVH